MSQLRVLLIGDEGPARHLAASAIASAPGMSAAVIAKDERLLEAALPAEVPDVCLLSLGTIEQSDLSLLRKVRSLVPSAQLIVLSHLIEERAASATIETGACGYLLISEEPAYLINSIRQAALGGSPISPLVAREMLAKLIMPRSASQTGLSAMANLTGAPSASSAPSLTAKEIEVLQQVAKGHSFDEIASSLQISIHTITSHMKNLYRKLSVRSRGEAVFEALQLGLIRIEKQTVI